MKKYLVLLILIFFSLNVFAWHYEDSRSNLSGEELVVDTISFAIDLDITSSPARAGIIGIDSNFDVYVSTGTGAGAWVKIGSQ